MKKLLHERLREAARNGVSSIETCDENIVVSLLRDEELSLADEIEKYYIPRPRFEDGEPVQTSDMEEIGGLATCRVYTDGSWKFNPDKYEDERNPKPWDEQKGRQCDFIKRPEPKVLDADGVEIKAGQTRWHIPTGKKVTIQDLGINKKTAGDSVGLLGGSWVSPLSLSLKEPDSLEKLQQFAVDSAAYAEGSEQDKFLEIADCLTAIMERDA